MRSIARAGTASRRGQTSCRFSCRFVAAISGISASAQARASRFPRETPFHLFLASPSRFGYHTPNPRVTRIRPRPFRKRDSRTRSFDMTLPACIRSLTAVWLLLAATIASAQEPSWSPEKRKESEFAGRKLDTFRHGVKKEWGYAAPNRIHSWCFTRCGRCRSRRCTSSSIPPATTSTRASPARPRSATTTSITRRRGSSRSTSIAGPIRETGGGGVKSTKAPRSAPRKSGWWTR